MKINKLIINSFGAIKDTVYDMENGITLFEGRNEAGKSTVGAFVKFMFFGLSPKSDGSQISERRRYLSWDGDCASGSIEFSTSGGRYRIDRTVSASPNDGDGESVTITDLDSGEQSFAGEDLGMYFFGVTGDVFSQTAYVRQSDGSRINGSTVLNAIENMLFSGDENIDTDKICEDIDALKSSILYKNKKGGLLYETGTEKERIAKRLEEAREQNAYLINTEYKIRCGKEEIARCEDELAEADKLLGAFEAQRELEKFALLDKSESELVKAKSSLTKYKNKVRSGDFIPDRGYLDEITSLDCESRRLDAALRSAEDEKKALGGDKIDSEDIRVIEQYNADGEENGLRAFFENSRRIARLRRILGVFFIVFGILWAALGAMVIFITPLASLELLGLKMQYFGFAGAGIAVIMIVLSILFFVLSASVDKKADRKIESYGVTSEEDIYVAAGSAKKRALDQEVYVDKLAECESRCSVIEFDILQQEEAVRIAASRFGKEINDGYTLDDLIGEVTGIVTELEKHQITVDAAKDKYESLKELTKDLDRERSGQSYSAVDPGLLISENEKQAIADRAKLTDRLAKLNDKITEHKLEMSATGAAVQDTAALLDELYAVNVKYNDLFRLYNALDAASSLLKNASIDLRSEVSPRLSLQAGDYMRRVTGGSHLGLNVSSDLSIKYGTSGKGVSFTARESDYMSEGTKDIAYISLRLALIGFLYKKELPPLVFDESFSRLDDDRLTGVFRIISDYAGSGNQAFIFTSQGRDQRILSELTDFNYIKIGE